MGAVWGVWEWELWGGSELLRMHLIIFLFSTLSRSLKIYLYRELQYENLPNSHFLFIWDLRKRGKKNVWDSWKQRLLLPFESVVNLFTKLRALHPVRILKWTKLVLPLTLRTVYEVSVISGCGGTWREQQLALIGVASESSVCWYEKGPLKWLAGTTCLL